MGGASAGDAVVRGDVGGAKDGEVQSETRLDHGGRLVELEPERLQRCRAVSVDKETLQVTELGCAMLMP